MSRRKNCCGCGGRVSYNYGGYGCGCTGNYGNCPSFFNGCGCGMAPLGGYYYNNPIFLLLLLGLLGNNRNCRNKGLF
ncbi:hypothetical protein [Clostridium fallax]|uniref:Uncharacterized protein n=1 Tax=Clostridium fallax TaxID=1533 RepID=A0A1M4XHA5_9CLOT|nr:hypothetical protein [Clostridium fallax]SHE92788.1 hypothetical protein SAMN05443638_11834 [Clostridium fallax]SQB06396.1 Uncharacterised protein [Clostridium fallax]